MPRIKFTYEMEFDHEGDIIEYVEQHLNELLELALEYAELEAELLDDYGIHISWV